MIPAPLLWPGYYDVVILRPRLFAIMHSNSAKSFIGWAGCGVSVSERFFRISLYHVPVQMKISCSSNCGSL
jgi:hypothetical protein